MAIYGKNEPILAMQEDNSKQVKKYSNKIAYAVAIIVLAGLVYAGIMYLKSELTSYLIKEISYPVIVEVVNPKLSK